MTWSHAALLSCFGIFLGIAAYLLWPLARRAARARNHRTPNVLGVPHPSCDRRYVP